MRRSAYRRALGSIGTGSLVIAFAACSLVTSLDDLTGGSPDGGAAGTTGSSGGDSSSTGSGSSSGGSSGSSSGSSGGSSSGVSPPPPDGDASADGASDDGGTEDADAGAPDAGAQDGGSHVDSAPSPYCASLSPAPLFCDDFDEGALAAPWDQLASTNGSEQLSTSSYVSAPYAMLASVDPNAPVTAIDVAGYKSFPAKQGVTGTPTLSLDVRIDAADESSASDAIVAAIQLWNGSAYWDLELEVFYESSTGDFKVSMSEDGTGASYVQHFVTPHVALGTWTRVTLGIMLPAGSGGATTATMAFNGTTVASETVHVSTSDPIPEILVGTTYATPSSGGWSVVYDDVTFVEP